MFSSCFNCPYKTTIARPKGNFTSPLVFIVGQCPGREEVRQGVVFVGPSGKLLDKLLAENKIPQDIIYFTNAIKCYHDTDEITAKMLKQCKPLLLKEIKEKKPKFIVALGGVAVKALLGNVKLTSVLNQPQDAKIEGVKVKILPTYHPAHALRNPAYLPDLKTTFKLLKSLLDNVEVKFPEIVCLESETDFKKATLELQGTVVGTDFETNHTEIFRANFSPVSVALATRDKIYFIRFDSLRKMMLAKDLFLTPKVHIFHDYLFDGLVLKKVWGIHALKYEDTMLLSYLIDENRPKGLKYLASVYLNLWYGSEMKKKFKAKEDITQIDEDELATYNATDAFATLLLYPKLWNELKEFQKPLYRMLKKFQKICAEMTYNGFPVDIAYIEELKLKFRQKEEELIKKLNSMKSLKKARKISWAISQGLIDRKKFLSSLEYDKEVLKTAKEQDLSPFKISDILAVFVAKKKKPQSKTPKGDLSTSEKELAKHDDEEFKLILEIRKLHKLYSTYLKGLSEKVCEDGRIHARFSVVGTATGRLCIAKDTLILVADDVTKYPHGKPIQDVKVGDWVYCFDDDLKPTLRRVVWAGKTGEKRVVRILWMGTGRHHYGHLDLTPEHRVRLIDGTWKRACELKRGDRILSIHRGFYYHPCGRKEPRLFATHVGEIHRESRFVYEQVHKVSLPPNIHIHHKDENPCNNHPNNLEAIPASQHISYHSKKAFEEGKRDRYFIATQRHKVKIRKGEEHPLYLKYSRFTLLRMLAKAKGSPTKMPHDYTTMLRNLEEAGIDWRVVERRYNKRGEYLSRWKVKKAMKLPHNERLKYLGVGYYRWRWLLDYYNIPYNPPKGSRKYNPNGTALYNHIVLDVIPLEHEVEVYNLEVEDFHNFIANELCVANSSASPNLQNIARDTTIKNIFVAPSGYEIVQYDWSQIELRVAAGLANERRMIEAYQQKADLHKLSASRIFKKPIEKVSKEERQMAKTVSFGVLYGISSIGLAERFNITPREAQHLIDMFYIEYPTLHKWEQNIIKEVKKKGYVISPFGRIRRLPAVWSSDKSKASEALRQAVNSPVQATASDINLIFLYEILKQYFPPEVYLVASVHDSGVFLVKDSLVEEFVKFLYDKVETFQHQFKFLNGVPLAIEVSVGEKWGELKEVSV